MSAPNVGLPIREFMYTTDQIAFMLEISEKNLKANYLFYEGRSVGVRPRDKLLAVDISPDDAARPEWRIAERILRSWMRHKGWKIYERGYIQ